MRLSISAFDGEVATGAVRDAARRMRRGFALSLDLLLPHTALDEGAPAQSPGLSAAAWSRIQFIEAPLCDGCGAPFEYDPGAIRCPSCTARPRAFARARAACLYDEHSRDLILKLKHADRPDLAPLLARWLSRAAADLLTECDAVVPVPLHRTRLFSRRYNQAAEIARALARLHKRPYRPELLTRARDISSQGGRSARGRRTNVQGAFRVSPGAQRRIAGKRLLLIDDVLTTGATAEACAKALLRAGAASVDLAVVARVREAPHLAI